VRSPREVNNRQNPSFSEPSLEQYYLFKNSAKSETMRHSS